ncbi:MAG: EI24 domain-containing protein [Rhodocyclaceae bacterium]
MGDILMAFRRAAASLAQPLMLWHLVWPTLAALLIWGILGIVFWGAVAAWLAGSLGVLPWLEGSLWAQPASAAMILAVHVLMALVLVPLVYATAVLLAAGVAVPLMLGRIGETEYADLERRRGGSLAGSAGNAALAFAGWLAGSIVTAPLWLVPGLGLVISVALSAWLNQRAFRYDALMEHADAGEMRAFFERERGRLYVVGLATGALAYVPVINLVAPAWAGLAFVHYGLAWLRRSREGCS